MPRKEKPLDPTTGPLAAFANQLRDLRMSSGNPTYRAMAAKGHYSPAALSVAAGGSKLPTWDCTLAYIKTCGVTDEQDVREWRRRWEQTRAETRATPTTSTSPGVPGAAPAVPHSDLTEERMARMRSAVDSIEEFVDALSAIRVLRGLSYRQVAQRSRTATGPGHNVEIPALSRSTIHDVLHRRAPVKPRFVRAYLTACGAPSVEIERWTRLLRRLTARDRRALAVIDAHGSSDDTTVPENAYDLAVSQLHDAMLAQLRGDPDASNLNESSELLDAATKTLIRNLLDEELSALQRAAEMFRVHRPGDPGQLPATPDPDRVDRAALLIISASQQASSGSVPAPTVDSAGPASRAPLLARERPPDWTRGAHRRGPELPDAVLLRRRLHQAWHTMKLKLLGWAAEGPRQGTRATTAE